MTRNADISESAILALTGEIPNYAERIAATLGSPITELWGVVLAATGRMTYVDAGSHAASSTLGVADASLADGRTRLELWQQALLLVIDILGDPEASYRIGSDARQLRAAVEAFFDAG